MLKYEVKTAFGNIASSTAFVPLLLEVCILELLLFSFFLNLKKTNLKKYHKLNTFNMDKVSERAFRRHTVLSYFVIHPSLIQFLCK